MPRYSEQLRDHLAFPRNAGALPDASAIGRSRNEACGDMLDLYLRLDEERIAAAGFLASGCPPALAAGSALTELLLGLTVEQAQRLRSEQIECALGGVPRAKRHALALALDALSQALDSALK